jgi:PAS domain S-box-containing protein
MPIHKKIITIIGLGMFLFMTIVVLSLMSVVTTFSSITSEVERTSSETQHIINIEKAISAMSYDIHHSIAEGEKKYQDDYNTMRSQMHVELDRLAASRLSTDDRQVIDSLQANAGRLETKATQLFALEHPLGTDRVTARSAITQIDDLTNRISKDIETQVKEEYALQNSRLSDYVYFQKTRIIELFVVIVLLSLCFLIGFSMYIHRKVADPLMALGDGAMEISRGNLEYRIRLEGNSDVAQLAERFNDMAVQLKRSYSELEKKLLDRTNELAAIDAVALTLSQAASLKEMLSRSLDKILESLSSLGPHGGVFLCNPDGETLRLMAHSGLPLLFVEQEETIKMGECLCGIVAQNGEILYTENGCSDARHTRGKDAAFHSHIIIPIKSRGIVLGVIFLYPQKEFSLKPSDLQMLDTIGTQLGMAVENLRFYAEVKESSEKFWDLFENSRDILFTMDTSGTLTAANRAAEKFSGYTKPELIGKSVFDFLTPDAAQTAKRMISGDGISARQVIEFEVLKRDGSRAFIEMNARRLYRQKVPAGYQVSARDMTEQKLMREKLLKAERLGAIGEVVITVRHEINNPLTTVIGNIELLIERYGDRDKNLVSRLEAILSNSLRIAEIVKQLQAIKHDKVVEYVNGVSMTDLKQE